MFEFESLYLTSSSDPGFVLIKPLTYILNCIMDAGKSNRFAIVFK